MDAMLDIISWLAIVLRVRLGHTIIKKQELEYNHVLCAGTGSSLLIKVLQQKMVVEVVQVENSTSFADRLTIRNVSNVRVCKMVSDWFSICRVFKTQKKLPSTSNKNKF